ncbi:SOS response-associated peptidase [Streptomyces yunnanensis]|uniref:Abasic site processing protein n=1 Tax=Streptomyces yunnanensis TaxID=156453 RepID=A0A9X8QQ56_9ACTN|nr:SOS response-associated peptidase [Streptomyces yunnanensis]SHL22450.1 Putative SOS response-associated peptidase YedK [Streptomyces yunnanensis]
MCGRYAASRQPEDLVGIFDVQQWQPTETLAPSWNIAPTANVQAVLERPLKGESAAAFPPGPVRQLRTLKWGLVPSWAKSPEGAARMINARAETVHEKPSFRQAFATRRCLLPGDGYFEWVTGAAERELEEQGRKKRPRKQPYFVTPADGSVMAMAGLYEFWRDRTLPGDHPLAWWVTCTVVTTEAETTPLAWATGDDGPRTLADIHPRMPLVLPPDRWDAWLDPARTDPDDLRALLSPPPPGLMRAHPVPTGVSNVRNNGPELVTELEGPEVGTLF